MSGATQLPDAALSKADAFVVSCIDPRTTGDTAALLAALGRTDRYSEMRVAGAALAAVDASKPCWSTALWENLAASRQLHGIRKVTLVNHRDCGAMHAWAGRRIDDPLEEERLHTDVLRRAAAAVRERHPDLLIELKLLNLDGTAQVIQCDACLPVDLTPETAGPAIAVAPVSDNSAMADPKGFAELLRVRGSDGERPTPEAELALLSQGITRYGLSAQQVREINADMLTRSRPTANTAKQDVLAFLQLRVDAAGTVAQPDLEAAGKLYQRLVGRRTGRADGLRMAAMIADGEGMSPRPRGVWPFRSTAWFQKIMQAPAGAKRMT